MYNDVYEEQAVPDRNYVKDNQAPQQSRTDPSSYLIKESNYEISPSIIEDDDSSIYEIYPEILEDSEFARRSFQTSGNFRFYF